MATALDGIAAEALTAVTLIVKAPNQKVEDKRIACDRMWTVAQLKEHLSTVYPEKPVHIWILCSHVSILLP